MTKYLLECGYEYIQVCAGRDSGVDHLRYMGAQKAAKEFAEKKQKVQFTALGMNYAKRKESYAWLLCSSFQISMLWKQSVFSAAEE